MNYAHVSKDRNVEIRRERHSPCLWEQPEPRLEWKLSISFGMIVRTMRFFAAVSMEARLYLKIVRVELLLFPAMTLRAPVL